MYLYIILTVITIIYLFLSACMDFKERKIYSFPAMILSISWFLYLISTGEYTKGFLVCYTFFNIAMWFLFNRMRIWGAGDSDMFLLLANVLLAVTGPIRGCEIIILECSAVIGIMCTAIIFGFIEGRVKRKKINLKSKVAVVPGFTFVITVMLLIGVGGIFNE